MKSRDGDCSGNDGEMRTSGYLIRGSFSREGNSCSRRKNPHQQARLILHYSLIRWDGVKGTKRLQGTNRSQLTLRILSNFHLAAAGTAKGAHDAGTQAEAQHRRLTVTGVFKGLVRFTKMSQGQTQTQHNKD